LRRRLNDGSGAARPDQPQPTLVTGNAFEYELAAQSFQERFVKAKLVLQRPVRDASLALEERNDSREIPFVEPHRFSLPSF
jgi:hypothetical protein